MGRVVLHISMSLDGFAAGPDTSHTHPLGVGGEPLHRWIFGADGIEPSLTDRAEAAALIDGSGAFVMGRTMFDVGEPLWGQDGAWGKPCFVLTHRPRPALRKGPTLFEFVPDGAGAALEAARSAAGDAEVAIVGGPTTARQFLAAGLVGELRLHLVPLALGRGVPLFDGGMVPAAWQPVAAVATELAVHLRLRRGAPNG